MKLSFTFQFVEDFCNLDKIHALLFLPHFNNSSTPLGYCKSLPHLRKVFQYEIFFHILVNARFLWLGEQCRKMNKLQALYKTSFTAWFYQSTTWLLCTPSSLILLLPKAELVQEGGFLDLAWRRLKWIWEIEIYQLKFTCDWY